MNDERMRHPDEGRMGEAAGMDDAFRARMRQGVATMAVRERVRERARNRAIAGGALATVVVATAAIFGVQALGGAAERHDQAAPPTPTRTAAPEPTVSPTPQPTPTEQEPTPPPGFEGVAAGEPVVTGVIPPGDAGDAGAAGGPHPSQIEGYVDAYVLCEGDGRVYSGDDLWVDCGALAPGTVIVDIGTPRFREWDDPELTWSADFDGEVRVVPNGEQPEGVGVGGTATVHVECLLAPPVTIGGVRFDCEGSPEAGHVTDLAAWGLPFGPDVLVPRIEVEPLEDGQPGSAHGTIRFVIER